MSFNLTKSLAEHLFEAFSIQRWNDRIRVIHLNEMDKNAYKTMLAYFLGKKYEATTAHLNWQSLIDKLVYDLIVRISTSDIGSAVHGRLKANRTVYVDALNNLLNTDLKDKIGNENFFSNFKDYVKNNYEGNLSSEDYILRLSHNLSVEKEYNFISSVQYNTTLPDHKKKITEITHEVLKYSERTNLSGYIKTKEFEGLLFCIDSLRFQERWAQTQRVPRTNVLGHSLYVALLYYFSFRYSGIDQRTFKNTFFAALFHDFLESYTRDVINPVKSSSKYFSDQIAKMEEEAFESEIKPNLDESFAKHFEFLVRNEFKARRLHKNGTIELDEALEHTDDNWEYAEGIPVKICDSLAALIEAHQSIDLGISSRHLEGAITRVYAYYKTLKPQLKTDAAKKGFDEVFEEFISK
jgi:putative hydrolases of HD superfamily